MKIELLDHGYLELIETWGSDERIIETARVSTQKGFKTWERYHECTTCGQWFLWLQTDRLAACEVAGHGIAHTIKDHPKGDAGLLAYLWKHKHSTPFEFAGLTIEVQAPIFVFREWHRHRTEAYSEASARYAPLPDLNYVPTVERLMMTSGMNKQAGVLDGAQVLTETEARIYQGLLREQYSLAQGLYDYALKAGVPKELARVHLPVGRYSKMRATANLRNWLAFMTLRSAPDAQWEIRQYSNALATVIAERFPRTSELWATP